MTTSTVAVSVLVIAELSMLPMEQFSRGRPRQAVISVADDGSNLAQVGYLLGAELQGRVKCAILKALLSPPFHAYSRLRKKPRTLDGPWFSSYSAKMNMGN